MFYEEEILKQEKQRPVQDRGPTHAPVSHTDETTPISQNNRHDVTPPNEECQSSERGRVPPLELLSRLFPTQKKSVMELILKGCHGDLLRAIECVLPSHEKAVAASKSTEYSVLQYNSGMRPPFVPPQARSAYPSSVRPGAYPIYGSHSYSYPMVEYMAHQKCALGPKSSVNEEAPYKMGRPMNDQHANIIGKVCPECATKCSPSSNFCSSCGKCFTEA